MSEARDANALLSDIDDMLENTWGPNSVQPTELIWGGTTDELRVYYEKQIGRTLSDPEWQRVMDYGARHDGRIYIGAHDV